MDEHEKDKTKKWDDADRVAEIALKDARLPRIKKRQGEYTVEDYRNWPEDERVELIDGEIIRMEAPSAIHQAILMYLSVSFVNYVRKKKGKCMVFPAAFDVQLDQDNRTMVQPDISVICHLDRLNRKGCFGSPDLVVEILSPSTEWKDKIRKLRKYANAGVKEYWIVDPTKEIVIVYPELPDTQITHIYTFEEPIPVGIWQDECKVDFREIEEQLRILKR